MAFWMFIVFGRCLHSNRDWRQLYALPVYKLKLSASYFGLLLLAIQTLIYSLVCKPTEVVIKTVQDIGVYIDLKFSESV